MKRILALTAFFILIFGNDAAPIPIKPLIKVGDTISGTFRYDLSEQPQDQSSDPTQGEYFFTGSNSLTISIGSKWVFSSASGIEVKVTNGNMLGNSDFIQISGIGDQNSFAPFLNGFKAQTHALEPWGLIILNFHFPHTYLQTDSLPMSIDPTATVGPLPGSTFPRIYGQIEGVSSQAVNSGKREWSIFFLVDPNTVTIANNNVISGTFTGVVAEIDDRGIPLSPPVRP